MAQRTKPTSPIVDPPKRILGGDELFGLMSELVSLREKVAQAELANPHSRSPSAANSAGNRERPPIHRHHAE